MFHEESFSSINSGSGPAGQKEAYVLVLVSLRVPFLRDQQAPSHMVCKAPGCAKWNVKLRNIVSTFAFACLLLTWLDSWAMPMTWLRTHMQKCIYQESVTFNSKGPSLEGAPCKESAFILYPKFIFFLLGRVPQTGKPLGSTKSGSTPIHLRKQDRENTTNISLEKKTFSSILQSRWQFKYLFYLWPHHTALGSLVSQPGIETWAPCSGSAES